METSVPNRFVMEPFEFELVSQMQHAGLDKLPSVIDTVFTAVRNGELDQQLAEASNQASPRKPKGKRAA